MTRRELIALYWHESFRALMRNDAKTADFWRAAAEELTGSAQ
jgi:hypothetical protein